jgi:hypothetical protein
MFRIAFTALTLALTGTLVHAQETPSPEGARVYIISPADGAVVSNPVTVAFGLAGMGVAPAGTEAENTGHHHLLIDIAPEDIALDEPLPATEQIVHFGGGQTQVTTELPPGEHTLRLLLGDQNHVPHDPPVISEPIVVTVE